MANSLPGLPTEPCPVCGHAEADHIYWEADDICAGWAHCTVEADDSPCACWRDWPVVPASEADRARLRVIDVFTIVSRGVVAAGDWENERRVVSGDVLEIWHSGAAPRRATCTGIEVMRVADGVKVSTIGLLFGDLTTADIAPGDLIRGTALARG